MFSTRSCCVLEQLACFANTAVTTKSVSCDWYGMDRCRCKETHGAHWMKRCGHAMYHFQPPMPHRFLLCKLLLPSEWDASARIHPMVACQAPSCFVIRTPFQCSLATPSLLALRIRARALDAHDEGLPSSTASHRPFHVRILLRGSVPMVLVHANPHGHFCARDGLLACVLCKCHPIVPVGNGRACRKRLGVVARAAAAARPWLHARGSSRPPHLLPVAEEAFQEAAGTWTRKRSACIASSWTWHVAET